VISIAEVVRSINPSIGMGRRGSLLPGAETLSNLSQPLRRRS